MKLAIIMSGMLRNFNHTFYATRKFILDDKFFDKKDIFFCGYPDKLSLKDSIESFESLYKPEKYKIQEWNEKLKREIELATASDKWEKFHTASAVTNIMSAWRCRYIANQLKVEFEKENNFEYDLVFQLRPDLFCFDQINHYLAKEASIDNDSVYIPKDWDHKVANKLAIGDMVAFGSTKSMNKYFSLYLNAKRYWAQGIPGHPETIMGFHFKIQNLNRKYFPRNLAREYPYTIPSFDYLWAKWPKSQVLEDLDINEEFLENMKKNNLKITRFSNFLVKIGNLIIIRKLIRFFKKLRNK